MMEEEGLHRAILGPHLVLIRTFLAMPVEKMELAIGNVKTDEEVGTMDSEEMREGIGHVRSTGEVKITEILDGVGVLIGIEIEIAIGNCIGVERFHDYMYFLRARKSLGAKGPFR